MESNEQNNKQNRNRLINIEKSLTAVRGEWGWGLGEKGEEIKQKTKTKTSQTKTTNSTVITREKGVGGGRRR